MAFAELGLTEKEFFSMSPRHTFMKQMYQRRKRERLWEQTRYIAAMVHNMAPGQKRRIPPRRLVPLSLDKKTTYPEWTKEEADDLVRKWRIN